MKTCVVAFINIWWGFAVTDVLTHKQLETHGGILSTVATDGLVLKYQAISIHSADEMVIVLDQFHTKIIQWSGTIWENKITFWKIITQLFKG